MKGFRTVLFNIVSIAALASSTEAVGLIPPEAQPWIAMTGALGNLVLRSITTTPIGQKQ